MTDSDPPNEFFFCGCQPGAERVCKAEVLQRYPFLAFAFSRPGFLTFKVAQPADIDPKFAPVGTFVRCSGKTLARVTQLDGQLALWLASEQQRFDVVHIWQRDPETEDVKLAPEEEHPIAAATAIVQGALSEQMAAGNAPRVQEVAEYDQRVLDIVRIDPELWFIGEHWATTVPARWPGGVPPLQQPVEMISRAYLKTREAIEWSRMPITHGETCVEIGAAPGGSCQALLELGAVVIAVDPAELDPAIASHRRLKYFRGRSRDIRRVHLKQARWLLADLNVAPNYTLDAVEDLVNNQRLKFLGLLLTLKLMEWDLAAKIPEYVQRVKEWGFDYVRTRQLAHNRREFCLAALVDKSLRTP